ncbi:hypothetical protein [Winogradskyella sp. PG-2]|uniref:hypothetical protein n=1 Tax=Winogradskyella sp. PG-2 TaxID=754409 RepID=UPI0004586C61|nr:hypothetical protein [Winogradskyella sp. PG-2]BAO76438.1 hypothetical protein WPG_2208 [Winogradskyella sp. PG-2]BAO76580.1 hypothetical protein WPG_2350 [Winogradskyella sp. PG-2]
MKKILLTFIIGILICSCSATKIGKDKTRYFDKNNVEISKSKFNRIRSTNKLLNVQGDSINHRKLTLREKRGKINDRKSLELLLEKATNLELDSTKPIVIIYYPGKDPCNSSGSATKESRKIWFGQLEDGINQVAQTKPIYIYKENDGLKKYDGVLTWYKDPEGTIERLFFEHHYPCSSFVVISKNGDYMSYFGEFGKEYVWEATQIMNK